VGGADRIAFSLMFERLKQRARGLKRDIVTLWFAYRHPQMPLAAKIAAILIVAYAFSPIDLIPDFIPVLGFLDEVILLPAFIWLTLKLIPEAVVVESRIAAHAWMDAHRPKPRNYIAAAIIIVLWTGAAWLVWRWLTT
jgi:uncharacterized membrane protein YkvA (DUF1232 family)